MIKNQLRPGPRIGKPLSSCVWVASKDAFDRVHPESISHRVLMAFKDPGRPQDVVPVILSVCETENERAQIRSRLYDLRRRNLLLVKE